MFDTSSVLERAAAHVCSVAEDEALLTRAPEGLDPDEAIDFLAALQRRQSALAALESRALVTASGPRPQVREITVLDRSSDVERRLLLTDEARDEVAAALTRSPNAVHDQIVHARLLDGPLRDTRRSLAFGEISAAHARAMAGQARRLVGERELDDPDVISGCAELERRVLRRARTLTAGQTLSLARRAVDAIDARAAQRRRERARALIDVTFLADDDGHATLLTRMPVADAARLHAAIAARASAPDLPAPDNATVGERRVAALVDLACGGGRTTSLEIGVVMGMSTLLGLDDEPATIDLARSTEPLGADAVRDLLRDPAVPVRLRRLVVDPMGGTLLDRGRQAYAVDAALRAFIVARDVTCRFPGCGRRAARCDIDHVTAWEDGGSTDRANLGALCRRHHQLKTHGGWEIAAADDTGRCMWVSPRGRRHPHAPPVVAPAPPPVVDEGPPPF